LIDILQEWESDGIVETVIIPLALTVVAVTEIRMIAKSL